jgi:type I restriction enzyme S subunit
MMSNKNWREVFIPEELFFQEGPGVRNTQFRDTGVKLLNVGNINNGVINLASTKTHLSAEEAYGKYSHFLVDEGDLLIACSGIIVDNFHNKIAFATSEHLPLCLNTSTMRFKPLNVGSLEIVFFKYFLQSEYFKGQLIKLITGSAQLNFGPSHIKKIKIKIPPLEQQKKIAAILDAADAYRQKTKALIAKYDELTQSLFLDMFGDPVKNEKGWEVKTIEQLVKDNKNSIKRGPFGGALKKEIFVSDGYLVYEQFHALNNDFSMARYFIDERKFQELKGFEVQPKDIIISCSGVYLGKLAIVPNNARKGIINQALLKVTLNEEKMKNNFFVFLFSHKNFREKYFDANRGAGIPNFPPMSEFKKFPFISPPIILQNQFTAHVQVIEVQKAQAQASLVKAEELFNSLLQRAFKGELV